MKHDTEQSTRDCGNTAGSKSAAVSPTPAQIESARAALRNFNVLVGYIPMEAALTAAAEVGYSEPQGTGFQAGEAEPRTAEVWQTKLEWPDCDEIVHTETDVDRWRLRNGLRNDPAQYWKKCHRTAKATIVRLETINAELVAALEPLLEHYLNCYDGNLDEAAYKARAALAKVKEGK